MKVNLPKLNEFCCHNGDDDVVVDDDDDDFVLCVLQVGGKDNPALDPIIHGLRGVVHHGECC